MSSDFAQQILDLETQFWQSMKDKDVEAALRLTEDPCIVTGAQGVARIDSETFAKLMTGGQWALHDFRITDAKVEELTDDIAVIGYEVHEKLTVEGEPLEMEAADASTWVRKNGGWVCALHTESLIGDPFGRDRKPS